MLFSATSEMKSDHYKGFDMKNILILIFIFLLSFESKADSPLTSTEFYVAYEDHKMVQYAAGLNGIIDGKLMKFLANPAEDVAVKMATINVIGWQIEGRKNANVFAEFLDKKRKMDRGLPNYESKYQDDDLMCLAYLMSMDNYFDVNEAARLAQLARDRNPKSYTVNIVTALIFSQQAFDHDWCKVWTVTNMVRENKSLTIDMKPVAIQIIFEYMDLYQDECNGK